MPRAKIPGLPQPLAWQPPEYDLADAGAIQALARGDAGPEQQRRALTWVIERAANTYDVSFRPGAGDGDRATAFAEGRRFVGTQVVKLTKLNLAMMRKAEADA